MGTRSLSSLSPLSHSKEPSGQTVALPARLLQLQQAQATGDTIWLRFEWDVSSQAAQHRPVLRGQYCMQPGVP